MPSQGPLFGQTYGDDASVGSVAWTNATQVALFSSNNVYATASLPTGPSDSHYIKAVDFGVAIPVGAVVTGVQVDVERKCDTTGSCSDLSVRLVVGGSIVGNDKADTVTTYGLSDATVSYGGDGDTWGLSLTKADVEGTTFGVVYAAHNAAGGARAVTVDTILLTVFYAMPGPAQVFGQAVPTPGQPGTFPLPGSLLQFPDAINAEILTPIQSEVITTNPYLVQATVRGQPHHLQFEISSDGGTTWQRLCAKNRQAPWQAYVNTWRFPNGSYKIRVRAYGDSAETHLVWTSAAVDFTTNLPAGTVRDIVGGTDTIAAAITAAADGDTIRVDGTFPNEGTRNVNKRVKIIQKPGGARAVIQSRCRFISDGCYSSEVDYTGAGAQTGPEPEGKATVIRGTPSNPANITNANAGIALQEGGVQPFDPDGAFDTLIENVNIFDVGNRTTETNAAHGIYAQQSLRLFVRESLFWHNAARQIQLYPSAQEATIYKCALYDSEQGIVFGGDTSNGSGIGDPALSYPYRSNYCTVERCIIGKGGGDDGSSTDALIYAFWGNGVVPGVGSEVLENFLHDPPTAGPGSGKFIDPVLGGFRDAGGNILSGSPPGYTNAAAANFILTGGALALGYGPDRIQALTTFPVTASDTGATISDTLVTTRTRVLTDTGSSVSDTVPVRAVSRPLTDTGASVSDTLVPRATRALTDTGASISDSTLRAWGRVLADTGATLSDSTVRKITRVLSDTGSTISDSLAAVPTRVRALVDYGAGVWNVVWNGGFETDLAGWTASGLAAVRDTSQALFGSASAKLTWSGSGADKFTFNSGIPLQPGQQYLLSLYIKRGSGSGQIQVWMAEVDPNTGIEGNSIGSADLVPVTSGWNRFTLGSSTIGSPGNLLRVRIQPGTSGPANGDIDFIEGVQVELLASATPHPYFDTNFGSAGIHGGILDSSALKTTRGLSDTGASVSDSTTRAISRKLTDTGATVSDNISTGPRLVTATDTGATVSDSLASSRTRVLSDTGASVSDSVAKKTTRVLSDTGASVSDSVAPRFIFARSLSDTGAAVSDSVSVFAVRVRVLSDTGASVSDATPLRSITRVLSDTGATVSDATTVKDTRTLSDTGATVSDSVRPTITRTLTDTGSSVSDTTPRRAVTRVLADTGATISDSVVGGRSFFRTLSDTGASISDATPLRAVTRVLSDTGATISDQPGAASVRKITDTGASISDSVRPTIGRRATDTGASVSDSTAIFRVRVITLSDTGASVSDTVAPTYSFKRPLSDTGATITDSLTGGRTFFRTPSDTGATVSDSTVPKITRTLSDTGASITDSPRRAITRPLSDTGATISDSVAAARVFPRTVSDTGASVSDTTPRRAITRVLSDTGAAISDTASVAASRKLTDTGASISDAIPRRSITRVLSDTGASVTDTVLVKDTRTLSDTGASVSDSVLKTVIRSLTDTGAAVSDSISRQLVKFRVLADTGASVSDSLLPKAVRALADVGASISDSMTKAVVRKFTDVGASISDTIKLNAQAVLSDVGASISDGGFRRAITRVFSEVGAAITDRLDLGTAHRDIQDTGATVSDTLTTHRLARQALVDGFSVSDGGITGWVSPSLVEPLGLELEPAQNELLLPASENSIELIGRPGFDLPGSSTDLVIVR